MKTIQLLVICCSIATFSILTGCGGGETADLTSPDQAAAHDGSFSIFITKTGDPPVAMRVKETTPLTEVHTFAAQELGIAATEFDLRVAGKKVTGTIADLGFKDPGKATPVPVGNIIAKMK